jgi:nucleotide-binding universal stress UspA family protein
MKTILVPVDFSDVTPLVVDAARRIALAFGSRVVLLHVAGFLDDRVNIGYLFMPVCELPPQDLKEEQTVLSKLKDRLAAGGTFQVDMELLQDGDPLGCILAKSASLHADLIIMGSHGHGALYNLLAGSVTAGVLKSSPCPVLVVPSPPVAKRAAA